MVYLRLDCPPPETPLKLIMKLLLDSLWDVTEFGIWLTTTVLRVITVLTRIKQIVLCSNNIICYIIVGISHTSLRVCLKGYIEITKELGAVDVE
jgi:hypothetical protein